MLPRKNHGMFEGNPSFRAVPEATVPRPCPLGHTARVIHSTTILAVRHQDRTVLAGDGQVTFGNTVLKQGARKIRRLYN